MKYSAALIAFITIILNTTAQTDWMIAERIDRHNPWNLIYYSARKTGSADTINHSIPYVLLNAVYTNTIRAYISPDEKAGAPVAVSFSVLKSKFDIFRKGKGAYSESITGAWRQTEIVIFRKVTSSLSTSLKELPAEWISINILSSTDPSASFVIYLRAGDCMNILKHTDYRWSNPINQIDSCSFNIALQNRRYLVDYYSIVSSVTLRTIPAYTNSNSRPVLAKRLIEGDANHTNGIISVESTTQTSIHLWAVCKADLLDQQNAGWHKASLSSLLINKAKAGLLSAFRYEEDGAFNPVLQANIDDCFFIYNNPWETDGPGKQVTKADITDLYIIKQYHKYNTTVTITNEWLVLGSTEIIHNESSYNYIIAFRFADVVKILASENKYWFNGSNEADSMRLDDALRTQRLTYSSMIVYPEYNHFISYVSCIPAFKESVTNDRLSTLLYPYTQPLTADLDVAHKRLQSISKNSIHSYYLTYTFDKSAETFLNYTPEFTDLILKGIRENKLSVFNDSLLSVKLSNPDVLYKLDRSRFYKTGNHKKDSIYISKIPIEERYMSTRDLTEFVLFSRYIIRNGKAANEAVSFGIIIPADLNPQYDPETLGYVSFTALLNYLNKSKEGKKFISSLQTLSKQKRIMAVSDFYSKHLYIYGEENSTANTSELPAEIRNLLMEPK